MRLSYMGCICILAIILSSLVVFTLPGLSVSTDKPAYRRGELVTIIVTGAPGVTVGVECRDPDGNIEFVKQLTIGADGRATTKFRLKSDAKLGKWTVYAAGGGETASTTFRVKASSSISISLSKNFILIGESVVISGRISPPTTATVSIYYSYEGGSWKLLKSVVATAGSYSYEWTPEKAGVYKLKASWAGTDKYFGATSSEVTLTVSTKRRSFLEITIVPEVILLDQQVTVTGVLTPPLADITITLTYIRPDGTIITRTVTTNATGGFTDVFTPDAHGIWKVYASWPGNVDYLPATSLTLSFEVRATSLLEITVHPEEVLVGDTVVIVCKLTPPLENMPVTIEYRLKDKPWEVLARVLTDELGQAVYMWKPEVLGEYHFRASWPGTVGVNGTTSDVVKLMVVETIVTKEELMKKIEELEEKKKELEKELEDTKSELNKKIGELERTYDSLIKTEKELKDAKAKISELEGKIEDLSKELETTKATLSTYMTLLYVAFILGLVVGIIVGIIIKTWVLK